jgi:hypothetical protein
MSIGIQGTPHLGSEEIKLPPIRKKDDTHLKITGIERSRLTVVNKKPRGGGGGYGGETTQEGEDG